MVSTSCSSYNLKDVGAESRKGCFDIDILFCAHFHEAPSLLPGIIRAHVVSYHLLWHINFVTDKHYDNVFVTVILDLLLPCLECQETISVTDIVNQKTGDGATEKDWCEGLESLLPQRVPDVELGNILSALDGHILALIFDFL